MENQQEEAEHFSVSPMTIRTLLVNHKKIEREGLDFKITAAAYRLFPFFSSVSRCLSLVIWRSSTYVRQSARHAMQLQNGALLPGAFAL
jgi:hypothetical protein